MPNKRLSMRKIVEVLRLSLRDKRSVREVASLTNTSRWSVEEYVRRAAAAGIGYPLPDGLTETELESRLFPPKPVKPSKRVEPDYGAIHQELRNKHVTLDILWRDYKAQNPESGYQYSAFCERYRRWLVTLSVTMRQHHAPGEKLFVDYAGATMSVIDSNNGEVRQAQLFIGVMGASNYTYVEATWSQTVSDWIGSHERMLRYLGAAPTIIVPDNLKAAVIRYVEDEPVLNPTYERWSDHYGIAIIPARPRSPKHKAKVEAGVLVVERWIVAALRKHRFFSLSELNAEIARLLTLLNNRPFKKLPGNRATAFATMDKPAMQALRADGFVMGEWMRRRVGVDYHVEVAGHYYSVPYRLARQEVDVRVSEHTVEAFFRNERIASHVLNPDKGRHSTDASHMPNSHRVMKGWTPERFMERAQRIGPSATTVMERWLHSRRHPEQGFRSCRALLGLLETFSAQDVELACIQALALNASNIRSIRNLLKNGMVQRPNLAAQSSLPFEHANVRGPKYYH